MSGYESPSHAYVVSALENDTSLQTMIGGAVGATRIYPAWQINPPPEITKTKRMYIVAQLSAPKRSTVTGNRLTHREIIEIHVYSFLTDRALRRQVTDRVKALFVGKTVTPTGQAATFVSEVNSTEVIEASDKVVSSLYFNFDYSELNTIEG